MSNKQRGKGDPRKAWGAQSQSGSGNEGTPRESQDQRPPNFADSNAFGPPLGQRARPNRNAGPAPSASSAPAQAPQGQAAPAWGRPNPPSQQQPKPVQKAQAPPQGQAQAPSTAWGKPNPPPQQQPVQRAQAPQGQAPSAWGQPATTASQPPAQRAPPSYQAAAQAAGPSAGPSTSTQKKRNVDSESSSGSATKYQSDEKTRGEASRGAIHGNRPERNEDLIQTRPKHLLGQTKMGKSGRQMVVKANYFQLKSHIKWEIYQYHVEFVPEIENPSFRNALLMRQRATLGGFLYDRGSNIFTIKQLEREVTEISTRDRDDNEILIKIKRVGLISPLENRSIQVLNIIVKKALKELNLQRVGRDYFDPEAKIQIREHKIELWPGYTTSIRQHEKDLLLLGEIKHKLMRDETVLDVLQRCYNENRQGYQKAFLDQVGGVIVLTKYNNQTYRINDVKWNASPSNEFPTKDGPITYIDYYKTKRGITIRDIKQPLLISTPTEKDVRGARGRDEEVQEINLIPELCYPTGYTDEMRKNFRLMKDVSNHTRVGPGDRIRKLLAFNQRLRTNERSVECFRDWSLALDQSLVTIPTARQLPWETILLGDQKKVAAERADWTSAFQGRNTMFRSEDLPDNAWIAIVPQNLERDADDFIKTLLNVSHGMRFNMGNPRKVVVPDDRQTTLSTVLNQQCNTNPKMILICVSNNQADRYSVIKRVCSVQYAVPSQVVTRRVMDGRDRRKMMSVATKVAIQMNTKIGGLPWNVNIPLSDCMFIGYDVCHDTRDRGRSFGALVATIDIKNQTNQKSKFFSVVNAHRDGQELSNYLSIGVISALKKYQEVHGKLPARIMFYRDGVGEGQTNYVIQHELAHLLSSLKEFYGCEPKLGFTIVSKRINTKFFVEGPNGAQNVPAGTIVDDVVTLPERYDFFLVSQHVNQGTATPTNYNVIHDTFGLPPDLLQLLTYKMCHLYYNWSGTTRVPAVCQYAHKLAFLVGNYLHQSPAVGLNDYLYFL